MTLTFQCLNCGHRHDLLELMARKLAHHIQSHAPAADPHHRPDSSRAPIHTGPPGGGRGPDPNTSPLKEPATDAPAEIDRRRPQRAKGSTRKRQTRPKGGGRDGNPASGSGRDRTSEGVCQQLRQRLSRWLGVAQMSIDAACKDPEIDLGASHQTLRNVLHGKPISRRTAESILAALAKLETQGRNAHPDSIRSGRLFSRPDKAKTGQTSGAYDESQVQRLGTKWRPDTGVNPLPTHDAPPRCSSVP